MRINGHGHEAEGETELHSVNTKQDAVDNQELEKTSKLQ